MSIDLVDRFGSPGSGHQRLEPSLVGSEEESVHAVLLDGVDPHGGGDGEDRTDLQAGIDSMMGGAQGQKSTRPAAAAAPERPATRWWAVNHPAEPTRLPRSLSATCPATPPEPQDRAGSKH
jgi:hypothetical protein